MMEVQQVREIYFEGRQFIFNHSQLRQSWRPIRQEFPSNNPKGRVPWALPVGIYRVLIY